jgi:hypothetical protein
VEVTCRISPDHASNFGETMALATDTFKVLIFDPESGIRLDRT